MTETCDYFNDLIRIINQITAKKNIWMIMHGYFPNGRPHNLTGVVVILEAAVIHINKKNNFGL